MASSSSSSPPSWDSLSSSVCSVTSVGPENVASVTALLSEATAALKASPASSSPSSRKGPPAGPASLLLSWCLSGLDLLEPIYSQGADFTHQQTQQINLRPLSLRVTLDAAARCEFQLSCLELFRCVLARLAKLESFSCWMVVLGRCNLNPFKYALVDVLLMQKSASVQVQIKVLDVLNTFIDKAGSFFLLIEKPKPASSSSLSTLSFTPLYQGLSVALEETHLSLVRSVSEVGDIAYVTAATRTVSQLLKKCPYHKMSPNVLDEVYNLARSLHEWPNPVAKIAGLNLSVPLLWAKTPASAEGEADAANPNNELCQMLIRAAFPERDACVWKDQNVRYVALQCLGQVTTLRLSAIEANLDMLIGSMDAVMNEKDSQIVLHTLRFLKLLAKNESAAKKQAASSSCYMPSLHSQQQARVPSFLRFWEGRKDWSGFLKPRYLQLIEDRSEHSLRAALCDALSDIGEDVHLKLQVDKRLLCVTYLLSHCHDPEVSVRTAAFRGIGMILSFEDSQTDVPFVTDCTDKILSGLSGSSHRQVVISATWALSNLCDALLVLKRDETGLMDEYPRHYLFRLIEISARYISEDSSHLSIKVNCLRSLGCLLLCTEEALSEAGGVSEDEEVATTLDAARDCVCKCIKGDASMKVRWNACYAASKILQNDALRSRFFPPLLQSLELALRSCKNNKVRINAAAALLALRERGQAGAAWPALAAALVHGTDRAAASIDENDDVETEHRLELIETSFLALCKLVVLGSREDLEGLAALVSQDWLERSEEALDTARRRVSPERASIFIEAATHLREMSLRGTADGEEPVIVRMVAKLQ